MDRLTEKILGSVQLKACGNDFCKETCAEHDEEKSCANCPIQKAFEKLAEYEDLEEQWKLLKLPCNVGDKMYLPDQYVKMITEFEIIEIQIFKDEIVFVDDSDNEWTNGNIGNQVFLTRPEAELALAEMEGKK